ncbi:MAG TPA: transposase, partial [bacterium]|nr:transposase [bacterium]
KFMSAYKLQEYTNGVTKEGMDLHSTTVQAITDEYATRRKQAKKAKLKWRKSYGSARSLGWIPFKASAIHYRQGQIHYGKHHFNLWDSYGLHQYDLSVGSFSEDAQGHWYVNIVATPKQEMPRQFPLQLDTAVGVDLGLTGFLTTSDGWTVACPRYYRKMEDKLAAAQRAKNRKRVKKIHAKIKNQRKDFHHKLSTTMSRVFSMIFVGDVCPSDLIENTPYAKSVSDAGWAQFKTMLQYKCDRTGAWYREVNEAFSTQTCSACDARSGPKGQAGLGVREWTCSACGAMHHRDTNAAKNILTCGRARLEKGILNL